MQTPHACAVATQERPCAPPPPPPPHQPAHPPDFQPRPPSAPPRRLTPDPPPACCREPIVSPYPMMFPGRAWEAAWMGGRPTSAQCPRHGVAALCGAPSSIRSTVPPTYCSHDWVGLMQAPSSPQPIEPTFHRHTQPKSLIRFGLYVWRTDCRSQGLGPVAAPHSLVKNRFWIQGWIQGFKMPDRIHVLAVAADSLISRPGLVPFAR